MSDIASHGMTQSAHDEVRHTLSLKEVENQLAVAGVPRSHRHVVRLCKTGAFDATKTPGAFGDEWRVSPASIEKVIGDLRAIEEARARHNALRHAAAGNGAPEESSVVERDIAGYSRPQPAASTLEKDQEPSQSPTPAVRYMQLLEQDNAFLREQVTRKDQQISELSARFSETQTLLGAMQRMFAPLLGQADPFQRGSDAQSP